MQSFVVYVQGGSLVFLPGSIKAPQVFGLGLCWPVAIPDIEVCMSGSVLVHTCVRAKVCHGIAAPQSLTPLYGACACHWMKSLTGESINCLVKGYHAPTPLSSGSSWIPPLPLLCLLPYSILPTK